MLINYNFNPKVYPNPITLNCVTSKTFLDTHRMPVDDNGKIITPDPNNMTDHAQSWADLIANLKTNRYEKKGPILTNEAGIKYIVVAKAIKVTTKISLSLQLNITADRNGAMVSVADVKLNNAELITEPSIRNTLTNKTLREIDTYFENKTRENTIDVQGVFNQMNPYKVNYRSNEAVFDNDNAFSGLISRDEDVFYCNKKRTFKVRIKWDRRFNEELGEGTVDW